MSKPKKRKFPTTLYITRDKEGYLLAWEVAEDALKIDEKTVVGVYSFVRRQVGTQKAVTTWSSRNDSL